MTTAPCFNSLPAEVRLEIYRQVWEPRIVEISSASLNINRQPCPPCNTIPERIVRQRNRRKPPVTLHINYEARQETLKDFHRYEVTCYNVDSNIYFPRNNGQLPSNPQSYNVEQYGYFNPKLDILHFEHLYSRQAFFPDWFGLRFPTLKHPVLRITLGRDIDEAFLIIRLANLLPCIQTIDFWSTSTYISPSSTGNISISSTSRYRLCRLPAFTPLTTVAAWENAIFAVVEDETNPFTITAPGFTDWPIACPSTQCTKPTRRARRQYLPGTGQRIAIPPEDIHLNPEDPRNTKSLIQIPCAVSHFRESNARAILKQNRAVIFNSSANPISTQTTLQREHWVVLKVVDPEKVWHKEVTSRAFSNLWHFRPSKWLPSLNHTRSEVNPDRWVGPQPDIMRMVKNLMNNGQSHHRDSVDAGDERWEPQGNPDYRSEVVHGVCGPEYLYGGQQWQDVSVGSQSGWHPLVSQPWLTEINQRWPGKRKESLDVEEEDGMAECETRFVKVQHWVEANRMLHWCD